MIWTVLFYQLHVSVAGLLQFLGVFGPPVAETLQAVAGAGT